MKTLIMVRHGKSDWEYESVRDIDRSLKERGIRDGYKMAGKCADRGLNPELIVSSTATRAAHTAIIFNRVLRMSGESLVFTEDLYLSDMDGILSVIYGFDDSLDRIMIVGHNPGFTDLANYLSNLNIMNVPTSGMVVLQFDTGSWSRISRDNLGSAEFDFPRNS